MEFRGKFEFLSNFYLHPVEYGGETWRSAEHAYQADKAVFDGDRFKIKDTLSPGAAKRLGRHIILRPGWDRQKLPVMAAIVRAKFEWPALASRLVEVTGEIVEHNTWHDNYWGSCTCAKCGDHGKNHLGRILMDVRDEIQNRVAG